MKKKSDKNSQSLKKRARLKIILALVTLGIMLNVALFGILSPIQGRSFYRLDSGTAVTTVASQLAEKNIIYSENIFKISVLLFGGRVQTGVYEIQAGTSTWRIAKMMTRGDIATITIVMPEGLTVKQIKNLLNENESLTGDTECAPGQKLDICNIKEGDLFPDTYNVPQGINRLAILELAKKKMDKIRDGWEHSGRAMPSPLKSWNEVITLASIVQKETPLAREMPTVASVYLNRLKKKMKLQADPTVVYALTAGLGDMQGHALYTGHLKTISPYNTYVNYGLPPAPIANVGRDAIAAVLNPADTTYLFFVADGQGGHTFARSYEEHQKNHATWREIKKKLNSNQ